MEYTHKQLQTMATILSITINLSIRLLQVVFKTTNQVLTSLRVRELKATTLLGITKVSIITTINYRSIRNRGLPSLQAVNNLYNLLVAGHDWRTLRTKWTCSVVNTINNNESVVDSAYGNGIACNRFFIIPQSIYDYDINQISGFIVLNKQYYLNGHAYPEP